MRSDASAKPAAASGETANIYLPGSDRRHHRVGRLLMSIIGFVRTASSCVSRVRGAGARAQRTIACLGLVGRTPRMCNSALLADSVRAAFATAALAVTVTALFGCGSSKANPTDRAGSTNAKLTRHYAVRGIYDRDFSVTGFVDEQALGFNFIDSGPWADQMDVLAAQGVKGFVWLGGYSNDTCTFNESDEWVSSHVAAVAGHPGLGAYFVDDEPDAAKCPDAPAQMKARSQLVKSIDPGPPTFLVTYKIDQFKLFAGTVDILGLDTYPCSIENGCEYAKIDQQAAEADRLGIRYWGVIQAWGDDWYKLPTPDELHQEFEHWRATNMEGYLVFAWRYPDDMPSLWLAKHPKLQAQLAVENEQQLEQTSVSANGG
jgi:hypothetical protein